MMMNVGMMLKDPVLKAPDMVAGIARAFKTKKTTGDTAQTVWAFERSDLTWCRQTAITAPPGAGSMASNQNYYRRLGIPLTTGGAPAGGHPTGIRSLTTMPPFLPSTSAQCNQVRCLFK
jgi:hypothetical protein